MRIAIFGMGYVGAVSAACLARDGHEVVGVDIDPHKLDLLRRGHSPIVEEGIQELTAQVVQAGRLTVTDDVSEAIRRSEVSFIILREKPRPSGRGGIAHRAQHDHAALVASSCVGLGCKA
ncbi:3-hydroxyacyl-CoA dehydrogenase NAD-binding domain-containing protein [Ectothiorhodospira shaposhnikovii]|uniref:3-hydroxyacyl-CoA dehydrogenase NAD-binding domain-containing protein n=1 Tax=Ectothiorhodospira shaposhnikovii TaxID=1054 RepID=UPI0039A12C80